MKQDMYCEQLCYVELDSRMVESIHQEYHQNWILDGLPSAYIWIEDEFMFTTRFWGGFPTGFVNEDKKVYINNHANIEVFYHENGNEEYQVTRFFVAPFSIHHEFKPIQVPDDNESSSIKSRVADISNPIPSCSNKILHTNYDMVVGPNTTAQEASGLVLFTYDVKWTSNPSIQWSDRWDIYITMDMALPSRVHWIVISNSIFYLVVLLAMIAIILLRKVRDTMEDAGEDTNAEAQEYTDSLQDKGYTLVHISIFDPPTSWSLQLLSLACGAGAQLFFTLTITLLVAMAGFLHSSASGSRFQCVLIMYTLLGSVNGLVSMQAAKLLGGCPEWKTSAWMASLGFPGLSFVVFLMQQFLVQSSTLAMPLSVYAILLILWFGVMNPLIYLGSYLAHRLEAIKLPETPRSLLLSQVKYRGFREGGWRTKSLYIVFALLLNYSVLGLGMLWLIRRCLVRMSRWRSSYNAIFGILVGGLFGFSVVFDEMYFIMLAVWLTFYYASFGFLAMIACIFFVSSAAVAVLFNYVQLTVEDSHSWLLQFHVAGSSGLWLFFYSLVFIDELDPWSLRTVLFYVVSMFWVSLVMYLTAGCIGFFASAWFVKKIFSIAKAGESMMVASDSAVLELSPVEASTETPVDTNNPETKSWVG